EQSIIWPIAQLLRLRGLCLIPAAAVVRDGWGALLLANFNLEPELTAMIHAGWRVLGQNWVAIRQDRDQMMMLHMPGRVNRNGQPVDLTSEFCGSSASVANCDAILLAIPGRRPTADVRRISPTNAPASLRRAWPIAELHPHRRQGQWPARLAHRCNIFDIQLSRNPREILGLLDLARYHRTAHHPVGELIVA
ncbi:MAG TPA: hypothetical protein VHD56_11380, partial [Tepidisphaeraceae bacterium]|nr:hypothetical protein [Tepidisphaeraceae bacterium]